MKKLLIAVILAALPLFALQQQADLAIEQIGISLDRGRHPRAHGRGAPGAHVHGP